MKLSIRDLDLSGRRVFIRVDFNVPLEERRRDRRHAHSRVAADDPLRAREGRDGDSGVAPRPAEGAGESEVQLEAGRREGGRAARPSGGLRHRLHRRRGEVGRRRGARSRRRRRASREPAIPSRRGKKRPGVRQAARVADRSVRERRVRRRASRSRVGRRDHAHRVRRPPPGC